MTRFHWWLCQFLLFLFVASLAYIKRFDSETSNHLIAHIGPQRSDNGNNFLDLSLVGTFWPQTISSFYQLTNIPINYSEYLLILFVIYYLWFTLYRLIRSSGYRNYINSLHQAPEMSLFTLTCLLILACIPLRLLQLRLLEDILASLIMFMLPLKLLFFCRASLSVGSFVVMIYKILVNDVLCFVVFNVIFVAGFSQCKLIERVKLLSFLKNNHYQY